MLQHYFDYLRLVLNTKLFIVKPSRIDNLIVLRNRSSICYDRNIEVHTIHRTAENVCMYFRSLHIIKWIVDPFLIVKKIDRIQKVLHLQKHALWRWMIISRKYDAVWCAILLWQRDWGIKSFTCIISFVAKGRLAFPLLVAYINQFVSSSLGFLRYHETCTSNAFIFRLAWIYAWREKHFRTAAW